MGYNKFYIRKDSGTFSDSIEAIGLASILDRFFYNIDFDTHPDIFIKDNYSFFTVESETTITEDMIDSCDYFDFFKFVIPSGSFPAEYENKYPKAYNYPKLSDKDNKPSNYDVIMMYGTMNRGGKNIGMYNKMYEKARKWREKFPQLLRFIFDMYTNFQISEVEKIKTEVNKFLKEENIGIKSKELKQKSSQIINPTGTKGMCRRKANNFTWGDSPKVYWLNQLIRITGTWYSYVLRRIKSNTKIYSIVPNDISFKCIESILKDIKKWNRAFTTLKTDIFMVLNLISALIEYHKKHRMDEFIPPRDSISGIDTALYKQMQGSAKAVWNLEKLSLPNYIEFSDKDDLNKWLEIIAEFRKVVQRLDDTHSDCISALVNFNQFISTSDYSEFFEFMFKYNALLMSDLSRNTNKQYLSRINETNLRRLFMSKSNFKQVIENEGFQKIAKAIRMSTVKTNNTGFKDYTKHYEIIHELKEASEKDEELITYLGSFISTYNNETDRIREKNQNKTNPVESYKIRAQITTDSIQDIVELIDEFGSEVVGSLLCAFGYSKPEYIENKKRGE